MAGLLVLAGGAGGFAAAGPGGGLLGAVAGFLFALASGRGAMVSFVRGAAIGAGFLVLVGPGADYLLSRAPMGPTLVKAVVAGALVGGALGIKNHRIRKAALAERGAAATLSNL